MKKHGVPDEDFYRGPIGDGTESERLHARIAELERVLVHTSLTLDKVLHELGIPGEGYPAPVSNAADFAKEALAEIKSVLGKGE